MNKDSGGSASSSSSSSAANLMDGGPLKCGNHKTEFVTTDPAQWQEHLLKEHKGKDTIYDQGSGSCYRCGSQFRFEKNNKRAGTRPLCSDCVKELIKEIS